MRILEGEGVTKHFGGLAAVSDVDFNIGQGEILGVIGPNGAGKTTLFNLISAALTLNSGQIKFKGQNITGLKPHKICRMGVARTFQSVKMFPNMSVLDNIQLGAFFGMPSGTSPADLEKEAKALMAFVGLTVDGNTPAGSLTLVNQKRLEIAGALATKPEILLIDELMAGLNPTEIVAATDLVTRIRDTGTSIMMIEHVMKVIMKVCDKIMVLHHGEKIAEGTPDEIATSKKVIKVYLGENAHAGS
jgi:branched-chain amino acid transport system ATP-binding protein